MILVGEIKKTIIWKVKNNSNINKEIKVLCNYFYFRQTFIVLRNQNLIRIICFWRIYIHRKIKCLWNIIYCCNCCLARIVFWLMQYFGQACKNQTDVEREAINLFHSFNYRQIGLRWEWEERTKNYQVPCRYRNSLITLLHNWIVSKRCNGEWNFVFYISAKSKFDSIYLLEPLPVSSLFSFFCLKKMNQNHADSNGKSACTCFYFWITCLNHWLLKHLPDFTSFAI